MNTLEYQSLLKPTNLTHGSVARRLTARNCKLKTSEPPASLQQPKRFLGERATPRKGDHGQMLASVVSDAFQERKEKLCVRKVEAIRGIEDMKSFDVDVFTNQ